jgi:hypothetical protein
VQQTLQQQIWGAASDITDAQWAAWEAEIVAAGREGRIVGALNLDGIPVTR